MLQLTLLTTITGIVAACMDLNASIGVYPEIKPNTAEPYATRKLRARRTLPLLYHRTSTATIAVCTARKQASPHALRK